ncbi:MAG: transcription-repair coupling factor [Akkermansiaceae bacterium]|nr:transcription-repair coupling factor [Akkermansiaceae bacterium]
MGGSPRHRERLSLETQSWGISSLVLPDHVDDHIAGELQDPDRDAERLAAFEALTEPGDGIEMVFVSLESFKQPAPDPARFEQRSLSLEIGTNHDPSKLQQMFLKAGFEEVSQVHARQQFARRGGILDVFPLSGPRPIRIDFFDTEIESLREFDLDAQTSVMRLEDVRLALNTPKLNRKLSAWRNPGDIVVSIEEDGPEVDLLISDDPIRSKEPFEAYGTPFAHFNAGDFILEEARQSTVFHHITDWLDSGWTVGIAAATEGERERFLELTGTHLPKNPELHFIDAPLAEGFVLRSAKAAVLSLTELFGRFHTVAPVSRLRRLEDQRSISAGTELNELSEDDLVVHADYGVGKFTGVTKNDLGDDELSIEYRDGATLHVPVDQAHLVSRYVGVGGKAPTLSRLGDGRWSKLKKSAEGAIRDYAALLLRTHAERESLNGYTHPPDSKWMWEFENSFPYSETADQLRAISEVKSDMESPQPMDRLICGDVGFGKTEVAIRAAFKAVTGGKQVAILVPTTVLADQHWRTFRERMSDFPIRVDLLNRFRTPSEMRDTVEGLANGSVDIVIGTHRLLSGDVHYQNLGLAVVDEEQRFGVRHKEMFKERFKQIDLLTLSATPIPRTLYFSLMGVRDMSTINTAPANRIPVHTSIVPYDERVIRDVLRRELEREGQVFFLHNRVKSIEKMKERIENLVPDARVLVGHGQMAREELEVVMHTFVEGKADVLLATTIIESGIDIPNANTILIDRADRFGLADLYQLRGRVGRANRRAYAVLMLPPDLVASGDARKRINAIQQYTALGSGFKIAMRDLEIRGAGSLLGTKQSGHIAAVGFDLYCQLLRQSVDQLSGKKVSRRSDVVLRSDMLCLSETRSATAGAGQLPAFLPSSYISDSKQRIAAYRELASLANRDELTALESRWRDRYGRLPSEVINLIEVGKLRIEASLAGVELVEIKGDRLMVQRNGGYIMLEGRRFPRLKSGKPGPMLREAVTWIESLNRS